MLKIGFYVCSIDSEAQGKKGRGTRVKCHLSITECLNSEFLNLGTVNTGSHIILFWEFLVHCNVFSSTPGLCPLDTRSAHTPPQFATSKNVSRHYYLSLGRQSHCPLRSTVIDEYLKLQIVCWAIHITLAISCKADRSPHQYTRDKSQENTAPLNTDKLKVRRYLEG